MSKSNRRLGSPLRYPGSKHKVARDLLSLAPLRWSTYVEFFFGSGAVFFIVPPYIRRIGNDLNLDLMTFWRAMRGDTQWNRPTDFIERILDLRQQLTPEMEHELEIADAFEQAKADLVFENDPLAFFLLNRYAHKQLVSRNRRDIASFDATFFRAGLEPITEERAYAARARLQGAVLLNVPFTELVNLDEKDVFLFLDPPYDIVTHSSPIYEHHMSAAEHFQLCEMLKVLPHKFLLTMGDTCLTARLYFTRDFTSRFRRSPGFRIIPRYYSYSGPRRSKSCKDREWIIMNYDE